MSVTTTQQASVANGAVQTAADPAKAGTLAQKIVEVLANHDPETRSRAIRAAMTLLGDAVPANPISGITQKQTDPVNSARFGSQVATWMSRNGISVEELEQVFHFEGGEVAIIASGVLGSTKKEQTVNCYVLEGIRAFLETGAAKFTDAEADALCVRMGCRDKTNHAANRNSAGNKLAGNRADGFTVVAPGLIHAAALIKRLAAPGDVEAK